MIFDTAQSCSARHLNRVGPLGSSPLESPHVRAMRTVSRPRQTADHDAGKRPEVHAPVYAFRADRTNGNPARAPSVPGRLDGWRDTYQVEDGAARLTKLMLVCLEPDVDISRGDATRKPISPILRIVNRENLGLVK
jgi:hypothetical protein